MNKDFLSLLRNPVSKEPLFLSDNGSTLTDGELDFETIKSVPVLLPLAADKALQHYREHYEKDAEAFDYFEEWETANREENRRLHQQILKHIPQNAKTILDVGCGGAWLASALIPDGHRVISMDVSTINPVKAIQQVPSQYHWGLVADAYALPIKDNSLDCIVAAEIIEHVKDPKLFIANLYNALKPGGVLIITTPYNEKIQYSLCIHCNKLTPHNAHLHSFTQTKIKSISPQGAGSLVTKTFNSKVLINLKIHVLLRFLPFPLWSVMDNIFVALFGRKAHRLMLVVKK